MKRCLLSNIFCGIRKEVTVRPKISPTKISPTIEQDI